MSTLEQFALLPGEEAQHAAEVLKVIGGEIYVPVIQSWALLHGIHLMLDRIQEPERKGVIEASHHESDTSDR